MIVSVLLTRKDNSLNKPFLCSFCLSQWFTLIVMLFFGYGWFSILFMFSAGAIDLFIEKILDY